MPRVAPPAQHGGRVEAALYLRCRRGEPAALATLAYRTMDRLYTAASFVAPDEASATTAVLLAWEDTLECLARHRCGGRISARALERLGRQLLDYGDRQTVRRALRNAEHEDEEALLPLPEEMVKPLVDLAHQRAPAIAAAHHERQALRRRVWQSVGAAGALVALYGGWLWLAPGSGTPELQLSCLQQRIARRELIENLRDLVGELSDPRGADRLRAHTLQQASLALEEIANARNRQAVRYVAQRVEREQLVMQVGDIATEYEEPLRQDLMETHLVLEEVQGL